MDKVYELYSIPGRRYLWRERSGAVDDPDAPEGGEAVPYFPSRVVEGVGEDFFPGNFDPSLIDEIIAVPDEESFRTARKLTTDEGVFSGGSWGMAVVAQPVSNTASVAPCAKCFRFIGEPPTGRF